jgi:hypothetical protein
VAVASAPRAAAFTDEDADASAEIQATDPVVGAPARADGRPRHRASGRAGAGLLRQLALPVGAYLASRVLVAFAALTTQWISPGFSGFRLLGRAWDGSWYIRIAQHGYPARLVNEHGGSRWAFFPAYPAVLRAVAATTGLSYSDAALLTSFVFGLLAVVGLWLVVKEVAGTSIADGSALLFVFFPSAYVLSFGYTEGLFLAAATFCLLALHRRLWLTAGLLAVIGSLTRNAGVVLAVCVGVAALPEILRRRHHWPRALLAAVIAWFGFLGWILYSAQRTGNALAFLKAETYWGGSHFVWFTGPLRSIGRFLTGTSPARAPQDVMAALGVIVVVLGAAALVWMQRRGPRIPLVWWVYTGGCIVAGFSAFWPMSVLRYSYAAFPLLVAFAWRAGHRWTGVLTGSFAAAQACMAIAVLIQYGHGSPLPLGP